MPCSVARGRVLVLIALAAIVGVSLVVIGIFVHRHGTGRLPAQVIRFALTAVLAVFVYRGQSWARWLAVLLIGGSGLVLLAYSRSTPVVVMGIVYAASAGMLVMPSASAFLARQRAARGPSSG
jgi:hypothetical protein